MVTSALPPIADNSKASIFVRFWTKADKDGYMVRDALSANDPCATFAVHRSSDCAVVSIQICFLAGAGARPDHSISGRRIDLPYRSMIYRVASPLPVLFGRTEIVTIELWR
jgi:hypothetical protein